MLNEAIRDKKVTKYRNGHIKKFAIDFVSVLYAGRQSIETKQILRCFRAQIVQNNMNKIMFYKSLQYKGQLESNVRK